MRTDFEQLVSEIQSDERFCTLSLANESVSWPSTTGLCYPVFLRRHPCVAVATLDPALSSTMEPSIPFLLDSEPVMLDSAPSPLAPSPQGSTKTGEGREEGLCATTSVLQETNSNTYPHPINSGTHPHPTNPETHSHPTKSDTHPCLCQDRVKQGRGYEEGLTLPKEKEELLQLRIRLSMELLWLKQAIASRQNVGGMSLKYL